MRKKEDFAQSNDSMVLEQLESIREAMGVIIYKLPNVFMKKDVSCGDWRVICGTDIKQNEKMGE